MEKNGRTDLRIAHGKGENGYYVTDSKGFKYMSDTPEMRQHLESLKTGIMIPASIAAGSLGSAVIIEGGYAIMANPALVEAGVDFIGSYIPTGAPSVSWAGYAGGTAGYFYGYENFAK